MESARGDLSSQLALAQEGQVVSLVAGTSVGFQPPVRYPPRLRKRITPSAPRYRGGSFLSEDRTPRGFNRGGKVLKVGNP